MSAISDTEIGYHYKYSVTPQRSFHIAILLIYFISLQRSHINMFWTVRANGRYAPRAKTGGLYRPWCTYTGLASELYKYSNITARVRYSTPNMYVYISAGPVGRYFGPPVHHTQCHLLVIRKFFTHSRSHINSPVDVITASQINTLGATWYIDCLCHVCCKYRALARPICSFTWMKAG